MSQNKIRVVELFAGVGGFRLGLEGYKGNRKKHHKYFETVWFNQWEPATKRQHAHETYVKNFGDFNEYTNIDIAKAVDRVPNHDLLVGGFPCQDYSVAKNLSASGGMEGKKGVLWWSIYEILRLQGDLSPRYLMLENVDRLLVSPAKQRGRDFAVILSCLNYLGYVVEWRIINAADYGMPQRRRRIFIMGYKRGSNIEKKIRNTDVSVWISKKGLMQKAFPANVLKSIDPVEIGSVPTEISKSFNTKTPKVAPFGNAGLMIDGIAFTTKTEPVYKGKQKTLGEFLLSTNEVPDEYFITDKNHIEKWEYLKGAKNEERKAASGFKFIYKEGAVAFPDPLDKPARTIITSEGGHTPSRFKLVVNTEKGLRRLTPIELERLCMFPDNHTAGHSDSKRAFFMGNALVVGVIDRLGKALSDFEFNSQQ